jgi:hypothetical protein
MRIWNPVVSHEMMGLITNNFTTQKTKKNNSLNIVPREVNTAAIIVTTALVASS